MPRRRSPRRGASPSVCDRWRANPLVNPRTNRRITRDGPTFQALQRECAPQAQARRGSSPRRRSPSPPARRSPRRRAQPAAARAESPCDQWRANPLVNPRSKRRITREGPVYQALQRECGQPNQGAIAASINQVQRSFRENMEQVAHILISRGPLTIRQLNTAARELGLTADNVNDALFTLITRGLVVREGNRIMWRIQQQPAAPRAAAGPDLNARTKLGLHPRLSRTEKLADLRAECSDMSDPITIEDFEDMNDDELATVVKIGERPPKHCYTLSNIRSHVRNQRQRNLPVKDPMNPGYTIPDRELNEIFRD